MNLEELKRQADHLESRYQKTRPHERLKLRPAVQRVMRNFASIDHPVPARLRQIGRRLDDDAYDDMFENMPV